MKRFLSLASIWSGLLATGFFLSQVGPLNADPTDELRMSLRFEEGSRPFHLMSVSEIAHVFRDRLDLFPKSQTGRLAEHLRALCLKHHFDPAFILSLIDVESKFKIKAGSEKGALGLTQIKLSTAQAVAKRLGITQLIDPRMVMDPFMNLTLGIAYLAELRDYYSEEGAGPYYLIAAYNIGPGRLNELMSQGPLRPTQTKKYYDAIRRGLPDFRYYRGKSGV